MLFAEVDVVPSLGGLAIVISVLVGAWTRYARTSREIRQETRVDALSEWQKLHDVDRSEIMVLKAELIEMRRQMESKFNRMMAHILYLERLLQNAGIKVVTWSEKEAEECDE